MPTTLGMVVLLSIIHDISKDPLTDTPEEVAEVKETEPLYKDTFEIELVPIGEFNWGYIIYKEGDCEYIRYNGSQQGGLTHKGDCSNPIHCHNR